jgi:hypothetical protein
MTMTKSLKDKLKEKNFKKSSKGKLQKDVKLCPFQSNEKEEVACSPQCALFRGTKKAGYECPFSEITSISWIVRQAFESKNNQKRK